MDNNLENKLRDIIRDVPDFPKKGILFKDITPILSNAGMMHDITNFLSVLYRNQSIDVVAGIESRGFIFGSLLAQSLGVPFVPIRKAGKLPYDTIRKSYQLEYGEAALEIHTDAFKPGDKVLIHDDLLATGGTAAAAAELIVEAGAQVVSYNFLIELGFLNGRSNLSGEIAGSIYSIVKY